MPSSSGPKISSLSNLVFCIDTYDTSNCVTPLGCGGWNGSTQGVKNILDNTTLLYQNGLRISNRQFYTAFGISYPESAYGGAAASRQGLTPGYSVLSGGKTYDASRALHLWVWDNNSNSWVPDSYFGGLRLAGHCYDNWAGAETGWQNELNIFNANVATIKQAFPNSTWIVCGSHASQCFDSTTINNMIDLGAPSSTISSWTDNSAWREFILVGKPGLGNGNAYGWAYENYSVNPAQVANMNLSVLPKTTGVLSFDGTDDYLNLSSNIQSGYTAATYEFVCRPTALPGVGNYYQLYIQENSTWIALYNQGGTPFFGIDLNNGSGWFDNNGGSNTGARTTSTLSANTWYHVVFSWASTYVNVYLNGSLQATVSTAQAVNGRQNVTSLGAGTTARNIGSRYNGGGNNWIGDIGVVNFYNVGLTAAQVQQNYLDYKTRFNLP